MVLGSEVTSRVAAPALMALCTALATRWLWILWTPRCNESCAAQTVLGMYGLLTIAALVTIAFALLVALGRWTAKRGLVSYFVAASILAAGALALTP